VKQETNLLNALLSADIQKFRFFIKTCVTI